jgi:hypothetical protein
MADDALGAESSSANTHRILAGVDSFRPLMDAFGIAKARFEANCYEGDNDESLWLDYRDSLNALMLSPAASVHHLAEKLRVFQAEGLRTWFVAESLLAAMSADARRLAEGH